MERLLLLSERLFPLFFWLLLMLGFDSPTITVITLASALIHELGHVAAYMILGKSTVPFATFSGFRINAGRLLSYKNELFVALCGPLANLLLFLLSIPFSTDGGYLSLFGILNLFTALSNLLPLYGYDGYRILHSAIAMRKTSECADTALYAFSFLLSAVLTFFSLFFILKRGEGYWIFGIFFASLTGNIFKRHGSTKSEI